MNVETLFLYIKICRFADSNPSFWGLKRFNNLVIGRD